MRKFVVVAVLALVAGCSSSKKKSAPGVGDFALNVPAYAGAPTGIAEPVGISVSRTGAASSIAITVTGLPAGITVDPLTIGATDTFGDLTFHVASGTPGDVPVQVVANGGGNTHAADLDFVVRGTPGALDPSFGTAGVNTNGILVTATLDVHQAALGSGGTFVVVGFNNNDLVVSRHHADGSLDTGFGTGGVVTKASFVPGNGDALSVAVAPDGKIVVAATYAGDYILARFTPDGLLDGGFGTNGVVGPLDLDNGSDDRPQGIAIDSAGRVLAAGRCEGGGAGTLTGAFVRFTSSGALDPSFGSGGLVLSGALLGNLVVDPSGSMYAGGNRNGNYIVQKVDSTGAPVLVYGSAGTAISTNNPFSTIARLAQFPDGRTVATGIGKFPNYYPEFLSFTTAGALDPSWGSSGALQIATGGDEYYDLLPVAGGSLYAVGNRSTTPLVLRVTPAGAVDTSFGTSGYVTLLASYPGQANSILPQAPYRALVVGGYQSATGFSEWSARIWQ